MSIYLSTHQDNPQPRLINQAVQALQRGGVIVYPTDSSYALGCQMGNKSGLGRIKQIRLLDETHYFTILCKDLSALGNYAQVTNSAFRLIKALTPGPYTFILKATKEVPKQILHPKRKTIGIRVPSHPVTLALLKQLQEPLMNTTLQLADADLPLFDPEDIYQQLNNQVDVILDCGSGGIEPTTVIDLVETTPVLIRQGKGDVSAFFEID